MGHSLPSFPLRFCGLWHMHQRCTRTDITKIGQEDGNCTKEHRLHIHPQQQVWFSFQLTPEFCSTRSAHVAAHHVHTNLGTQHLKCIQTPACLPGTADQDQASRRGARCPRTSPALWGNQRCRHPSFRSPKQVAAEGTLDGTQAAPVVWAASGTMQGVATFDLQWGLSRCIFTEDSSWISVLSAVVSKIQKCRRTSLNCVRKGWKKPGDIISQEGQE